MPDADYEIVNGNVDVWRLPALCKQGGIYSELNVLKGFCNFEVFF